MEMPYEDKNFSRFISNDLFIGKGSFGDVYGPCDVKGKKCAIKKRWLTNATKEDTEKELSACDKWMSLHHKRLITVYDVSLEPHAIYILMEFASGGSLHKVLSESKSILSLEVVKDWGIQIAEGMAYLHENDILHRDLKSPNIVIMEADASSNPNNKTLKITDFDQIREHDATKTMSNAGTCPWAAPEALTTGIFSKASDVWSYGVVQWEILTRNVPYKGVPDNTIIAHAIKGKLKLEIPNSCPDIIKSILNRCLSNDRGKRPSFHEIGLLLELQHPLSAAGENLRTTGLEKMEKSLSKSLGHRIKKLLMNPKTTSLPQEKMITSSKAVRTIKDQITQYRDFLVQRMDPDFGLLDKIRSNGTFGWTEMDDVTSQSSSCKRNARLLDYILTKDQCDGLITVLREADQKHIVNYLIANGEYSDEFDEDLPLTVKEISILDTNHESLVDLLQLTDLLDRLYSSKVINRRQQELISSKPTSYEKNNALLEILRRRSLRHYRQTITCLRHSKQNDIAEILEGGGVVVRVHANLDGENLTEAENEIATKIANLLINSSIDQPSRVLEVVQHKVIAAKTGKSIVLYIYCKTIEQLQELHESLASGRLKDSVELCFNSLLKRPQKIALTASDEEFQKMRTYFKDTDRDFDPSIEMLIHDSDDEQTLDEEEDTSNGESVMNELGALHQESETPMEETNEPRKAGILIAATNEVNVNSEEQAIETTQAMVTDETHATSVDNSDRDKRNREQESVVSSQMTILLTEKLKLRAIHDFHPFDMTKREEMELQNILGRGRVTRQNNPYSMALEFKRGDKMETFASTNIGDTNRWWKVSHLESGKIGFITTDRAVIETDHPPSKTTLNELPLELLDVVLEKSFLHWILNSSFHQKDEDVIKTLASVDFCWFQRITRRRFKERIWRRLKEKLKLRATHDFDPDQMTRREAKELQNIIDRERVTRQDNPHTVALQFKRGEKMQTISSTMISVTNRWWKVSHLDSGKIGLIPKGRVVIETDHPPSKTTLNELPLELLDVVLEKSFLHWILNPSSHQRDKDVIKTLASVDFCWFQRVTRPRFKKRIWHRLKDFYGKNRKGSAIVRNNRNYLLDNIQLNYKLIASMLSFNCITEKQRHFIQRQHSNYSDNKKKEQSHFIQRRRSKQDKNSEILHQMRSFDETKFSNFVKCLRQTNQKTVARIIENGGEVIKVEVQYRSAKCTTSREAQLLFENIEDLRNRTKPWSRQTDKLMSQLREEGIDILNSDFDRQTVVVWIWCHSQEALQYSQRMYESTQLRDVLFGLANIPETVQSKVINIDNNQFKKAVVMRPISINFIQAINVRRDGDAWGITKLRSEIYVLCQSCYPDTNVIRVLEDRNPFDLKKKIEIKELKEPADIGSSEKENCLYVSDYEEKCVWKIIRETGDQNKIIKWLTTDYWPWTLSVTSKGQLLLVNNSSSSLMIYGSDAELIRSIQLPGDIWYLYHAVETSIGNFIISYEEKLEEDDEEQDEKEKEEEKEEEEKEEENEGEDDEQREEEKEGDSWSRGRNSIKVEKEEEEEAAEGEVEEGEEEDMEEKEKVKEDEELEKEIEGESGSNGRNSIKVEKEEDEAEEGKEEEGGKRKRVAEKEKKSGSSERKKTRKSSICELSRDGQMIIRRFVPSNETQQLNSPWHLSLDSDDQVFVADYRNDRVILLDFDLKWKQILCPTKEETDKTKIESPSRLCYDEEKKQLIVGGYYEVNVYTLSRK